MFDLLSVEFVVVLPLDVALFESLVRLLAGFKRQVAGPCLTHIL